MLRHEKAVGNSNMVRLELLKPKWVETDEMTRKIDKQTGALIKPVIVVNEGNTDWYSKQFPLLISSHRYFNKNSFQKRQIPPYPDAMNTQFTLDPNVMWDEQKLSH